MTSSSILYYYRTWVSFSKITGGKNTNDVYYFENNN